jgi:PadR family transcriptional regulator PadR
VPPLPSHDPQLLKGVLSLLLLHLLAQRESYGYEVRLTTRLVASSSGPARKYYQPTKAGYDTLAAGTSSWTALAEIVAGQLDQPVPTDPIQGA